MRARRLAWLVAILSGGMTVAGAAVQLAYVDLGPGGNACCLLPEASGNLYVIGATAVPTGTNISITKLDSARRPAGRFTFGGGGSDVPKATALDPQGNLLIVGTTNSIDFPLVHALISETEPRTTAGFIAKVNLFTGQILFSTRIGGLAVETFVRIGTSVNAVAVDPAGNIYAAGWTNARDFPTSGDAFQKTGAGGDSFGPRPYGFVMKLSSDGSRMLYSTLLGGATANCFGGSHCIGKNASNTVNAIAVDRDGIVTAAGATNAPDFPITSGVVQTVCHCLEYANNGFVTRLNANGTELVWSTFLGGTWYGFQQLPSGTNTVNAVALDAAGNAIVGGLTDESDFPTTAGSLQPKQGGAADGFLSKLNSTATALLFSTYVGGSDSDRINAATLDVSGNIWLTGQTASTDFPGAAASFTGSFFAEVAADGARLLQSQLAPAGAAGLAIRLGSDLAVLGAAGSVLAVPAGQLTGASILGVASAAGDQVKGTIAPGEFISIYGTNFGTTPQVLFNGITAPVLYTSPGQLNALVPYGIAGNASVPVQVGNAPTVTLYVRTAQPEVFRSGTAALALNQDGSVNSRQNPADPGSIVTIFASGPGTLFRSLPDGSVATQPGIGPILPITVLLNGRSLEVLYAGNSPGQLVNLLQVNFRLPQQTGGGDFQLMAGDSASATFTIEVAPF